MVSSRRPRVSVIVRTLGTERTAAALLSLEAQDSQDFEAVVVDLSADPGFGARIEAHRSRLPGMQHLCPGRRLNRAAAMNHGLGAARGEAYAILDEDNAFAPEHIGELVEALRATGADAVYTGARVETFTPHGTPVDAHVEPAEPFDRTRLLFANFIRCSTMAIRVEAWRAVGGYDHRFPVYEDWEFLIRLADRFRIEAVPGAGSRSRSYTGVPGRPQHHDEGLDPALCLAGLRWVHRRRLAAALDGPDAALWRRRFPDLTRRGVRLRSLPLLLLWWWRYRTAS